MFDLVSIIIFIVGRAMYNNNGIPIEVFKHRTENY